MNQGLNPYLPLHYSNPPRQTQGRSARLRQHGWTACGGTLRRDGRPMVCEGRRRQTQRSRQGHRMGTRSGALAAERHHADGQRPRLVRVGAEGGDGRNSRAGSGIRALVACRRSGTGDGVDADRFPARVVDERLLRSRAHPVGRTLALLTYSDSALACR